MKHLSILILLFIAIAASAQTTRPNFNNQQLQQPQQQRQFKKGWNSDTLKVQVLYNNKTFGDGFVVAKYFHNPQGKNINLQQTLYDDKWKAIKPEDVYDITPKP